MALLASACAFGELGDGWGNLTKVRHDRGYTVLTRDGACISGSLTELDDAGLRIDTVLTDGRGIRQGGVVSTKVRRSDVLRASDNSILTSHDSVYSGRSSWADVRDARPDNKAEWLKIVRNDGRERRCNRPEVLDDRIRCGTSTVAKAAISRVYYVRLKPASDKQMYLSREAMVWLDARTWFNYALQGRIEVLLYVSSGQVENSVVSCKSWLLPVSNR